MACAILLNAKCQRPGVCNAAESLLVHQAIAERFLRFFAKRYATPARCLSDKALERLLGHQWPGNVRELRNVVERAVALGTGPVIDTSDIWLSALEVGGLGTTEAAPAYQPVAETLARQR